MGTMTMTMIMMIRTHTLSSEIGQEFIGNHNDLDKSRPNSSRIAQNTDMEEGKQYCFYR